LRPKKQYNNEVLVPFRVKPTKNCKLSANLLLKISTHISGICGIRGKLLNTQKILFLYFKLKT